MDLVRQLNQAFVNVADKVSPAVVVINVVTKPNSQSSEFDDVEEDGSFESLPPGFWRRFHEQFRQDNEKSYGQGSGVLIRPNGYILTSRHVVEDAESVEVRLKDGRTFKAVVRGVDPQSDVAVIKIDATGLPVARFADSAKTRVGEFAIAIGAPFSLDYSVTYGHVSAKSRSNLMQGYEAISMDQDFIQTDANINPGNSGGPLVNIDGEIIGINTMIRGLRTGIGFAIPSNLAREVSEQLITDGRFRRAWLGIGIRGYRESPELHQYIRGIQDGVLVASIQRDGPAGKSDLQVSDVILAVDGKPVGTPQELRSEIRGKKIDSPVTLEVFRDGRRLKVKVSPGEWVQPTRTTVVASKKPSTDQQPAKEPAKVGITVQELTPELAQKFNVPERSGVLISAVDKHSAAALRGLCPGDVITSVNRRPTFSQKQFEDALKAASLSKGILLNVIGSQAVRFEILKSTE
jgi:serine protease Do